MKPDRRTAVLVAIIGAAATIIAAIINILPNRIPGPTPTMPPTANPVVYTDFGTGNLKTYRATLSSSEVIVGNANTMSISDSISKTIQNRCVVYSIYGPGNFTISITNGSIKHYRDVDKIKADTYFAEEEQNLVQNSNGCGNSYPIYRLRIEGTRIVLDSNL